MDSHLQNALNSDGLRSTAARQLVFSLLKTHSALSMAELRHLTKGQIPASSLYRAIRAFEQLDIAKEVVISGKRKWELAGEFSPHHHHISCNKCGKTVDIDDEMLEKYLQQLAIKNGFLHHSHSFEITGLCKECHISV